MIDALYIPPKPAIIVPAQMSPLAQADRALAEAGLSRHVRRVILRELERIAGAPIRDVRLAFADLGGFAGFPALAAGMILNPYVFTAAFSNTKSITGTASSYLARTFGAGNRSKFALSYFVKPPASHSGLVCVFGGSSSGDSFNLVSGKPGFILNNGASGEQWTTTALTNSAWFHVLYLVDTAAAAGDRLRVFVGGSEVTSFGRDNNPSLNEQCGEINNSVALRIGVYTNGVSPWTNYIFDEIAFFDGVHPAVTDVRDSSTGDPKDLTGLSFGATGFWLRFEGGTAALAGTDSSGLSNTWTPTNVVDGDITADVP